MTEPWAVAISGCLLGEHVRYDGGHKRQDGLVAWGGDRVRWVSLCPEVLAGLSVPRPAIQRVRTPDGERILEVDGGGDHTCALQAAAARIVEVLRAEGVAGYVAKARSPSCGVGDADLVDPRGVPLGTGDGTTIAAVRAAFPGLPIASEEDVRSAEDAERFLARVARYTARRAGGDTPT